MQNRGPILIVFGLSLVLSPLAIQVGLNKEEAASPQEVRTVGQAAADCAAKSIETASYVIGCRGRQIATDNRRHMSGGGAMFVSVMN